MLLDAISMATVCLYIYPLACPNAIEADFDRSSENNDTSIAEALWKLGRSHATGSTVDCRILAPIEESSPRTSVYGAS